MQRDTMDYIGKLEALQQSIPSLPALVSSMHDDFVQYDLDSGFAVGLGLLHDGDCAVQKLFVTADAVFPQHAHEEFEYFIIVQGSGVAEIGGEERAFKAKDLIVIPPGIPHKWHYAEATKKILITIPAAPGFPHGKK